MPPARKSEFGPPVLGRCEPPVGGDTALLCGSTVIMIVRVQAAAVRLAAVGFSSESYTHVPVSGIFVTLSTAGAV